jgi:hypothetical protein
MTKLYILAALLATSLDDSSVVGYKLHNSQKTKSRVPYLFDDQDKDEQSE